MSNHQFEAWCSLHRCHPSGCFYIHNPEALQTKPSKTAAQQQEEIQERHRTKQLINKLRQRVSTNGIKPKESEPDGPID